MSLTREDERVSRRLQRWCELGVAAAIGAALASRNSRTAPIAVPETSPNSTVERESPGIWRRFRRCLASFWRRYRVAIVADVLLAGLLSGGFFCLSERNENRRFKRSEEREDERVATAERLEEKRFQNSQNLEDQRSARADKRSLQQTLYVADLREIVMPGEDLSNLSFGGRDLSGANLSGANLSEANLSEANLSEANLSEANLWEVDLVGADLLRADLTESKLLRADLTDADLSEANLSRAFLGRADLPNANLTDADLTDADLFEAYLTEADLTDADLVGVSLTRANLEGANLEGANLTGVKWQPVYPPVWPEGFVAPENAWNPEIDGG